MSTLRSIARSVGPIAGAGAAAALAAWVWRRWSFPVVETTTKMSAPAAGPSPTSGANVQQKDDGVGDFFHRIYRVNIEGAKVSARALMARIGADPRPFMPVEIAQFEKTRGETGLLAESDEFVVHIRSPWDGPVRVTDVSDQSFTLATLDGHMEAGHIRFSARDGDRPGDVRFEIESWARSADELVNALYDHLGAARAAQTATWTFFCDQVALASGGTRVGPVEVITERASVDDA